MNLSAEFELYSFSMRQFWPFFPEFRVKSQTSYHFWLFFFFFLQILDQCHQNIYLEDATFLPTALLRWNRSSLLTISYNTAYNYFLGDSDSQLRMPVVLVHKRGMQMSTGPKPALPDNPSTPSPTPFTETVVTNTNFLGCFDFAFIILYICDSLTGCE